MSEHTKEPWYASETDDGLIEIVNDERTAGEFVSIADVMTGFDGKIGIEQAANARRIVAAVNACEGMDTDSLESIAGRIAAKSVLQMHANYVGNKAKSASLEEQRDKLLAALEGLAGDIHSLIHESSGVAGLHLNDDLAPWYELEAGGRFERLTHLPIAVEAIAAAKAEA